MMHALWLLVLVILSPNLVFAGETGKLVSLLADYADLKQRVQDVREARKSGYSSDSKSLIGLSVEIHTARTETVQFRSSAHKVEVRENPTEATASFLIYAFDAMSQIVQAEIDRNLFVQKSDLPLRVMEKYEEIWRMVDASIPTVNASSEAEEAKRAPRMASPPKPASAGLLRLHGVSPAVSRFGVLFVNFAVENTSDQDLKDFTIGCTAYAPSGTALGQVSKTIYQIVPAHSTQDYDGMEIGNVHPQTFTARCQLVDPNAKK